MIEVLKRGKLSRLKKEKVRCDGCESKLSYIAEFCWRTPAGDISWDRPLQQAYIMCPECGQEVNVPDPDPVDEEV